MSATKRFEKLYRQENLQDLIGFICLLLIPIIGFIFLVTQNYPSEFISTQTATVSYVNSTSTNAETGGAGGQPISHVVVRLKSGYQTRIKVLYPPIPRVGDTVLVNRYEKNISGTVYLYGGINK